MNANELADELEEFSGDGAFKYYLEIAAVLRQQQAEIEALKAQATMDVMSEHCTCYKLGYSPLNNFTKVNNENNNNVA